MDDGCRGRRDTVPRRWRPPARRLLTRLVAKAIRDLDRDPSTVARRQVGSARARLKGRRPASSRRVTYRPASCCLPLAWRHILHSITVRVGVRWKAPARGWGVAGRPASVQRREQ
uniref:Uncharacterized protein n=1 Tax=Setaria italica TaxID=4555 RepID=K3XTP4_SETIT